MLEQADIDRTIKAIANFLSMLSPFL